MISKFSIGTSRVHTLADPDARHSKWPAGRVRGTTEDVSSNGSCLGGSPELQAACKHVLGATRNFGEPLAGGKWIGVEEQTTNS